MSRIHVEKTFSGDIEASAVVEFLQSATADGSARFVGADGELVPLDLAMGWGRMSDSAVLANIDIHQSGRFYSWHVEEFPIPRREIETSSANMHMIPADADVKRQLEQVRTGQVVHLEGFLVDATRPGGWHWNTSMSRNDTGAGACELIYVERVDVMPVP